MSAGASPLNPLVAKIRAAHPGAYDDMDDATLTKRVLAKYPQYSDLAGAGVPKPPNPIEQEIKSKPLQYNGDSSKPYPMPGSFEGHPENIGEYVPQTVGQVASGVGDISQGDVARGTHKIISGVGNATLPVAPFIATTAPMMAARAIGGGYVGGKIARGVSSVVGATPDQQDVAEDVGNLAGGIGGVKGPAMVKSAARTVIPRIANIADPEWVGLASPRAAHGIRVAQKMAGKMAEAPEAEVQAARPQLEAPPSEAAQHLQNRIAVERDLRAQEPFPRIAEGLPEVEEGQAAATEHLRKVVQPRDTGNFRIEQTPRRMPGEIAPEATRPRAFPARIAEPIPQRSGLMLTGETVDTRPAKVGNLLNEATGGKPLNPNIPLKNQLEGVTPVAAPRESSVVKSHSYDPNAKELTLTTYNGQTYKYGDVSPDQAADFSNGSKGQAFNRLRNSSSVLIEKNGKPVKPIAPRMATPNDLTPVLEESVRQAKAKKSVSR